MKTYIYTGENSFFFTKGNTYKCKTDPCTTDSYVLNSNRYKYNFRHHADGLWLRENFREIPTVDIDRLPIMRLVEAIKTSEKIPDADKLKALSDLLRIFKEDRFLYLLKDLIRKTQVEYMEEYDECFILEGAFSWTNTVEGFEFWSNIRSILGH